MKAQILKNSGLTEEQFYKKYSSYDAYANSPEGKAFLTKNKDKLRKAQYGKTFYGGDGNDVDYGGLSYDSQTDAEFMNEGVSTIGDTAGSTDAPSLTGEGGGGGADNSGAYIQAGITAAQGVYQGSKSAKGERRLVKGLEAQAGASDVVLKSFLQADVDAPNMLASAARRKREAMQPILSGNQFIQDYGTGTNVLAAKNGGEISNTYAPGTLYQDLGYAPLNKVKKAQNGMSPYLQGNMGNNRNSPSWVTAAKTAASIDENLGEGPDAGSKTGGAVGTGVGTIVGTYFGGPLGGAALGAALGWVGSKVGGALDKNDDKIKAATGRIKRNASIISGVQQIRGNYSANHENGGKLKSGGTTKQSTVGDVQALSGGYLEPIAYNPYSDGDGVTSMVHGQSHEESNGAHTGVLLRDNSKLADGGDMGPDVEVERKEPVFQVGEDKVILGNQLVNNITVGDDPMFKDLHGKTFKKVGEEIGKRTAKLNDDQDKLTRQMALYNPETQKDKIEGGAIYAKNLGLDIKYAVNDLMMKKLATHQEIVNNEAARLNLNSGDFSRGKLSPADTESDYAKDGKTTKRKKLTPIESYLKTDQYAKTENQPIAPVELPWANNTAPAKAYGVTPYNEFGLEDIVTQALPFFRRQPGEELAGEQIMPEISALASNKEEPVDARFYHPQLRTPYSVSYQDQLNANQSDFNQLVKTNVNNPEALSYLAAQKYAANSKVLAEQFRANQAISDQVYSQNIQTMNDAQMKNMQIADQQYVRQAQAKSATKAVKQEALSSIASKIAQNRLENRTLQTYANMFPDYSFDKDYRIRKTGAPVKWQIDQGIYNKQGNVTEVPVYDETGENIVSYKSITAKAKNGGLVKAFRDL